jgi:O-antigen/teichoic acid export membrane protein
MTDELTEVAEVSVRGSFFLISGTALATVIMAIGSMLVGRLLGAEQYGQYTLALTVPQLLFLFTDLGINQGITKFASSLRAKGEIDRATKTIQYGMLFRVLIGTAIFAVNFALADLFATLINRPNMGFYVQIAAISIIFQVIFTTANSAFVGLDKTEYNAIINSVQAIVKTILSVALVLLGLSIAGAIIGHVAGYVIASIVGASIIFLKLLKPSKNSNNEGFMQYLKILTKYGMPLYISILLIGFFPLYQQLILAFFATDADIGNFKAATNFIVLISIIAASISTALLPAFSKLDSSTTEKIKTFFKLANKYTCLLIVPTATIIMILSKDIVQTIYGSTFQSASLFLSIECILYLLVAIGSLTLTSLFNGLGETRTTLKIAIIHFLIFIVLAPFLTKTYNVPGLIIASLISNTIATSYASYIARTRFKIEFEKLATLKIYLNSAISGIPPLLLLHFTSLPALIKVIAGGLLFLFSYATLTPLMKTISNLELQKVAYVTQKIQLLNLAAKPLLKYQEKILHLRTRT